MINKYANQRSKIGNFFYKFLYKASCFLKNHMWLYWILHYTWGLPVTIVTWIIWLIALPFSKEHGRFGPSLYQITGDNWGGLSLGHNFLVAENMGDEYTLHTKQHEMGHTFQAAILGIFVVFLVILPSVSRYWYQTIRSNKGKPNKEYDLAWFEGEASEFGQLYYEEKLKNN